MFARSLAAVTLAFGLAAPVWAEDQVIDFAKSDPEMNAAIAKARDSLPEFWARFADPAANEVDFALKLGIKDANGTEHFWCDQIEGNAEKATCVIANEPVKVHSVAYNERIAVDPAIISDWMYYRDAKIVGGETIRVMLPHLDKKEAAALREQLAEP